MKKKLDHVSAAITLENVNKLDARWPLHIPTLAFWYKMLHASSVHIVLVIISIASKKGSNKRCSELNFKQKSPRAHMSYLPAEWS